jgi:hypothetical protein
VKRIIAFGIVALAITACGDERSAAPASVGDAVATRTAAPPVPSTTAAAPTTTEPMPTTTVPETTTTVATEEVIKHALQDYEAAYWSCGQSPSTCDPASFTAVHGNSRATITEFVNGLVDNGLYFSADLGGSHLEANFVERLSPTEVTAQTCWFDAAVVLGPIGPDGAPTVVNDEVLTIRYDIDLYLENDLWRVGDQAKIEELSDGTTCAASL